MHSIPFEEIILWKKKQLSKGGDKESLDLLLDSVGGLSKKDLNFYNFDSEKKIFIKNNLPHLELLWAYHLTQSCPIQYLCGTTYWRDLKLKITDKVLIPRPETELMVDIILKIFGKNSQKLFFAELGTGSGAISIAVALAYPLWKGVATDIDQDALELANQNYKNSCKTSNLKFYCGHWWNPLESYKGKLDLVISNTPYIPKSIYEKLPKQVKSYEPKIALFGGEDGLEHIREIIEKAPFFLRKNGWLILENHFDQGDNVKKLLIKNRFSSVETLNDFSGIGRFTIGRYK